MACSSGQRPNSSPVPFRSDACGDCVVAAGNIHDAVQSILHNHVLDSHLSLLSAL